MDKSSDHRTVRNFLLCSRCKPRIYCALHPKSVRFLKFINQNVSIFLNGKKNLIIIIRNFEDGSFFFGINYIAAWWIDHPQSIIVLMHVYEFVFGINEPKKDDEKKNAVVYHKWEFIWYFQDDTAHNDKQRNTFWKWVDSAGFNLLKSIFYPTDSMKCFQCSLIQKDSHDFPHILKMMRQSERTERITFSQNSQ